MAATAEVRMIVECAGLGPGTVNYAQNFTDSNTPDDFRKIETLISTTAVLLSALINVPSSEVLGLALQARNEAVYINSISTAISTAGQCIPDGQFNFFSYTPGNSCKIAMVGAGISAAVTGLVYAATT